ncbi:MAG: hypothetical protein GW780_04500, partial [Candidatus Aenigmarchaeota archaeon]|nr:hypothetical protein [Candidatus Aenigmarchaeota archaeon]
QEAYDEWKKGNEKPLRKILIPIEDALDIKKVVVKDSSIQKIRNGSPVRKQDMMKEMKLKLGEDVALISESGNIIGLGIAKTKNKIKTDRIFMG